MLKRGAAAVAEGAAASARRSAVGEADAVTTAISSSSAPMTRTCSDLMSARRKVASPTTDGCASDEGTGEGAASRGTVVSGRREAAQRDHATRTHHASTLALQRTGTAIRRHVMHKQRRRKQKQKPGMPNWLCGAVDGGTAVLDFAEKLFECCIIIAVRKHFYITFQHFQLI